MSVMYYVHKNFQIGSKEKRIHLKAGELFEADPNDSLTKELLNEKRIERHADILNKEAAETEKKLVEAKKKAEAAAKVAKEASELAEKADKSEKESKSKK